MINKKILITTGIVGGVAALGYAIYNYVYKQTKLLQDFEYKFAGIKFTSYNLNLIKGNIELIFTSKADIEFIIEQYLLTIFINGVEVGYVEDNRPFKIPAKGSSSISSAFTLNPQLIFKNITDILKFTTSTQDASFSVKGFVKVKANFVKLTVPIEYKTTIREILVG